MFLLPFAPSTLHGTVVSSVLSCYRRIRRNSAINTVVQFFSRVPPQSVGKRWVCPRVM